MKYLPVRFFVWLLTLVLFPISVTAWPYSFQIEVLQRITAVALPPRSAANVDLAERVLVRLQEAEQKEIDPWLRDDYRIAWITTHWAQRGVPEWSWHRSSSPHVAATYQVLHCHPDQVWPRIVAERKQKLGGLYQEIWGEQSSPKKPVQSVPGLARFKQQRNSAA